MTRFLDRYMHGECEQVWEELVALGDHVRAEESLHADALAVARETMRRARANIEVLISRLQRLGYVFGYDWVDASERDFAKDQPLPVASRLVANKCREHTMCSVAVAKRSRVSPQHCCMAAMVARSAWICCWQRSACWVVRTGDEPVTGLPAGSRTLVWSMVLCSLVLYRGSTARA
jgi:hypothetical protein